MVVPSAAASPQPVLGRAAAGADISWPQCPKGVGIPGGRGKGLPAPLATAKFVVLGLTNGPGFYPNPCLANQVAWVSARHLWAGAYSMTTYPTSAQLSRYGGVGTLAQRLSRTGAAQAAFNVATMGRVGLLAPMVWVDVEPYRVKWSTSTTNNNALIDGVLAGYKAAGLRTGIYSYLSGWKQITGGRLLPALPTWVPVGARGRAVASARCKGKSFTGGPTWMVQWTNHVRDSNITCPGVTGTPARRSPLTAYLNTILARGSNGLAVAALQRRLGEVPADGTFGPSTTARTVSFQRTQQLTANGIVTTPVWRALGAGTVTPARPSRMATLFAST